MRFVGLLILWVTALHASSAVKTHPDLPFECTYHFIEVGEGEHLMLDIIRSPLGNSVRFFHTKSSGEFSTYLKNEDSESQFWLDPDGNRVLGRSADLNFDIRFAAKIQVQPLPPPPFDLFNLGDIAVSDHPSVDYKGWLTFQGRRWDFTQGVRKGTISQHYGRKLPHYYYFNSLPSKEDIHVVGAFVVVPTAIGISFPTYYLSETSKGRQKTYTVLNSKFEAKDLENGDRKIAIHSLLHPKKNFSLVVQSNRGAAFQHEVDRVPTTTFFDSKILSEKYRGSLPAVVEARGEDR